MFKEDTRFVLEQSQLALAILLRDDAVFSSFYPGDNIEILLALKKMLQGQGETFIYIWGGKGSGKSHLLQAACNEASLFGLSTVYIPLNKIKKLSINMLDDLENVSLVCVDDIDYISGSTLWQEALFHFYNRMRAQQTKAIKPCRLLVSAGKSPLHIDLQLADLKSRLASGMTYQLHLMNDKQKLEALRLRAECRGLELNKTVAQFLLNHCSRNMEQLFLTLEKLDQASLAEQRRLTIPFVKQTLRI